MYFKYFYRRAIVLVVKILFKSISYNTCDGKVIMTQNLLADYDDEIDEDDDDDDDDDIADESVMTMVIMNRHTSQVHYKS